MPDTEPKPQPPALIKVRQSQILDRLSTLEGQSHLVLQLPESLEIPTAQQIAVMDYEVGIVINKNGTHLIPGTKHEFRTHSMIELGLGPPDGLIHNHPSGRRLPSGQDLRADIESINQFVMTSEGFCQYRMKEQLLFKLLLEQFLSTAPPDLQINVMQHADVESVRRQVIDKYKARGIDTDSQEFLELLADREAMEREDTFRDWYETLSNPERNSYLDPLLKSRPDMVQMFSWDDTEEARVMLAGGNLFE